MGDYHMVAGIRTHQCEDGRIEDGVWHNDVIPRGVQTIRQFDVLDAKPEDPASRCERSSPDVDSLSTKLGLSVPHSADVHVGQCRPAETGPIR